MRQRLWAMRLSGRDVIHHTKIVSSDESSNDSESCADNIGAGRRLTF